MKQDGMSYDARLHEAARRLGERAAERLDVEATARRVVERLREQPARRVTWMHANWLRVAATVVVLIGGALAVRQIWPARGAGHVGHLIADDLRDLSTDELRAVLMSFDEIVAGAAADSTADLQDLDAQALRQLLQEG